MAGTAVRTVSRRGPQVVEHLELRDALVAAPRVKVAGEIDESINECIATDDDVVGPVKVCGAFARSPRCDRSHDLDVVLR